MRKKIQIDSAGEERAQNIWILQKRSNRTLEKKKYMITGFVKEDETEYGARRELYLFTFYCIPEQQNGMLKYEMIKLAKQ